MCARSWLDLLSHVCVCAWNGARRLRIHEHLWYALNIPSPILLCTLLVSLYRENDTWAAPGVRARWIQKCIIMCFICEVYADEWLRIDGCAASDITSNACRCFTPRWTRVIPLNIPLRYISKRIYSILWFIYTIFG